ncbi:hypothetical protein PtB15_1B662 [Puccinia triticina]|nr:hypothetical protein PtB15_1B662 [Puccinia triticina]
MGDATDVHCPGLLCGPQHHDPRLPSSLDQNVPQYKRDFRRKLIYFRSQPALRPNSGLCHVKIRRSHIFEDSYAEIMRQQANDLKKRLMIKFDGEDGLNYGGVFWLTEADCTRLLELLPAPNCKALFRRGTARRLQRKWADALQDLQAALALEPNNASICAKFEAVKAHLQKEPATVEPPASSSKALSLTSVASSDSKASKALVIPKRGARGPVLKHPATRTLDNTLHLLGPFPWFPLARYLLTYQSPLPPLTHSIFSNTKIVNLQGLMMTMEAIGKAAKDKAKFNTLSATAIANSANPQSLCSANTLDQASTPAIAARLLSRLRPSHPRLARAFGVCPSPITAVM